MKGYGRAFGAVSVVNAIAGGRGATVGVGLKTEATVDLKERAGRLSVWINGKRQSQPPRLAVETLSAVLEELGEAPEHYSGTIESVSDIPVGVGLKSSSSSSAAIALATTAAFGRVLSMRRIMLCSAESSLKAGVSVTGAFDDVAGCLLGGVNLADNLRRKIVRSSRLGKKFKVVILLPGRQRSRRGQVDPNSIRKLASVANAAFEMSLRGDIWRAMTINGLVFSSVLGYDPTPALSAVEAGALGAGLSGTGPAIAAVFSRNNGRVGDVIDAWSSAGGRIIVTETNDREGRGETVER